LKLRGFTRSLSTSLQAWCGSSSSSNGHE
jgi:hypothetical protein